MFAIVAVSIIASATAFAPRTSSMRMSVELPSFNAKSFPGVSEPFGYFDPLGLSTDLTEEDFKKYRESEIKHGRVAMLAFLGIFLAETVPFLLGSKITGPAIFQFQQTDSVLKAFTANVIGFTAAIEGYNIIYGWQPISETMKSEQGLATLAKGYENGDLKFDPLGFKPTSPKALAAIKTKELNNGRLAMIAVAGIVAQELVTGKSVF